MEDQHNLLLLFAISESVMLDGSCITQQRHSSRPLDIMMWLVTVISGLREISTSLLRWTSFFLRHSLDVWSLRSLLSSP
jgi:hypothetical protein